ncbi:ATP-dependent DNA helicase RecG [Acidomonas methanolica]|uniref:DNA helicase RecG n=1 Tax=Acidomonas methanolica NBRC 104435 TaxID=1231351 RepID=A0A023D4L5_ACIMT|nr:ATP-dependent DNA helicase RecG [Acidomonas methanolica]MBU2653261.1 ATP-dependent DNA helicase RecG [Acidomonas methanolica]TCS32210.1 ATP-dependent DNA helicase RecG [Acidomonas methanolica]GAJ29014.1 DNA helicase RecG [Acidomonas methanolica NBRC 104435]GBQ56451.1 DNA helicase RecG [Acidomonas methanolica]GEK97644.1 ATP-dependent DNA helicase RecG [Acidomonas methanolica NBRC 104435]
MTEESLIAPLLAPLATLPGIGAKQAALLRKVTGGPRVIDLLFTLPESFIDRGARLTLAEARRLLSPGSILTAEVDILGLEPPARPRQPYRLRAGDGTDEIDLVFFHAPFFRALPQTGPQSERVLISGRFDQFGLRLSMAHPDYLLPLSRASELPAIEPVWPLTAGLFPSAMRKAMRAALALLPPDLPEWLDGPLVAQRKFPSFTEALRTLHAPGDLDRAEWEARVERARTRLACDELLADQLCLALARQSARSRPGRALTGDGVLRAEALRRFGHALTGAQRRALEEIDGDLAAPRPMTRLLQGDVGAGKTIVAALAMLRAAESGAQAALMAPTELLARQHQAVLERLCPVPCVFLSGSVKGRARKAALEAIANGAAPIVIGTHALFQEQVTFHDLGLAVIDEQHRFGVEQRVKLGAKGEATDVLVMTATPIPRTLLLTRWGEMQVSRLDEKPPGRLPVVTSLHPLPTLEAVIDGVGRTVGRGVQVYWVCPLVEESEASDLAAAEARFAALAARFGPIVGLAHGRQDHAARQAALDRFRAGETRILVATTVIEVGVDIPSASVMVVEHAERFGLAQLHQLRGRVGRGAARSFCLLLYDDHASATARRRLTLLRETEDGFLIADEDFRTRGGGDIAGSRQSGLPGFRMANGSRAELFLTAMMQDATRLIENADGPLKTRFDAKDLLLTLFDRGSIERVIASG